MIRRKLDKIEVHNLELAEDIARRLRDDDNGNRTGFSVDITPHFATDVSGFRQFTGATLDIYEII